MGTFVRAFETFVDYLDSIALVPLGLAIVCHLAKLVCRTRSWRNILAASYPDTTVRWRDVFGSYAAGVGVNALVPARGGDVLKLYLVKHRIDGATYPTLASTLLVETLFDFAVALALFAWAITLGVLPGLDVLPYFQAFDWRWMYRHPWEMLAIVGGILAVVVFLALRARPRVSALRERLRLGFAVLRPPGRYVRRVVPWQALDWCFRLLTIYFFLRAFGLIPSTHNALLVQVTQSLSTVVPFTPGGIGTEQALLVYVFAGVVSTTSLLAFSVGMKLVLTVVNVVVGFAAILLMLGTFRWRRHVSDDDGLREHAGEAASGG